MSAGDASGLKRRLQQTALSAAEAGGLCTACAASCCRLLGRGTKMVSAS